MKNPWNVIMEIEFDEKHKQNILRYMENIRKYPRHQRYIALQLVKLEDESLAYLKQRYESEGLKNIARSLGITYTVIRRLFINHLGIEIRKGQNVVTDNVKKFRSDRVKGDKNPFYSWPSNMPTMKENSKISINGYYKSKNNGYVWLRSSWEYIYAKWLDKHDIKWIHEGEKFKLSDGTTYLPDFSILSNDGDKVDCYVEIKGHLKKSLYKVDMLRSEYNVKISVIFDMKPYTDVNIGTEVRCWKKERLSKQDLDLLK